MVASTHTVKKAVGLGPVSPPIPAKLAEEIWKGEYIDLNELLPACLAQWFWTSCYWGTHQKPKKTITMIEEWVLSFNTFISVVAM